MTAERRPLMAPLACHHIAPRARYSLAVLASCWWLAFVFPAAPAAAATIEGTGAILQGLDKVTARVSEIEAPLHRLVRFGTLEIIVRACHKTPPEEPPESAAFLEIRDAKPGEATVALFTGWMFASSPALSALEHPVYDVWVLDCLIPTEPKPAPKAGD